MPQEPLFWSRRGDIACAQHAPLRESPQWIDEGWQGIQEVAGRRVKYQCQVCGRRAIQRQGGPPEDPPPRNGDDRPASLYARDRVLRGHGFTVTNADSGRAAL